MNLFKQAIDRYQMIKIGNPIIAGVSGGADSMALLHFLYQMYKNDEIKLIVAHVHHGLRGEEADRDEAFVQDYCAARGIPFRARHADVAALAAQNGQTVEECGREVRYAFFEELRLEQERPAETRIATAHTLSDSIETVLFHMARGTSLKGLLGIPPVRGFVIRPLILSTRADIEAYCAQNGVDYVTDSTNFCADYTRNRIRRQLVPQFYGINARFDEAFSRMVYTLSQDEDCLRQLAEQAICDSRTGAGRIGLRRCTRRCFHARWRAFWRRTGWRPITAVSTRCAGWCMRVRDSSKWTRAAICACATACSVYRGKRKPIRISVFRLRRDV